MKKYFAQVLILLAISFSLSAQSTSRTGGWFAALNTFKLSKKSSLQIDIHYRTSDAWQHMQTFIFRPGFSYKFKPNLWTVVGYNYLVSRNTINGVSGYILENQIWEQLWFRHPLGKFTMTHRASFEQRFVPVAILNSGKVEKNGSEYANRFRYWVRLLRPFKPQKTLVKGLYGVIQEEIFLNFGNISVVNGHYFDQSRTVAALGYRFSPHLDMEIGYMYRRLQSKGTTAFNDNLLQATTLLRL
jgi:hypothetical protein